MAYCQNPVQTAFPLPHRPLCAPHSVSLPQSSNLGFKRAARSLLCGDLPIFVNMGILCEEVLLYKFHCLGYIGTHSTGLQQATSLSHIAFAAS